MCGNGVAIGTVLIIMLIRRKLTLKDLLPARTAFCVVAVGTTALRSAAFLFATATTPTAATTSAAVFGWFVFHSS